MMPYIIKTVRIKGLNWLRNAECPKSETLHWNKLYTGMVEIYFSVWTDIIQHCQAVLSQCAPAAHIVNRAETYSRLCLLISIEISSKAN